ncbi:MAG: hypothetical protein EXR91_13060 [Gemmatimonadetes bacterium]|nr:hypothetical protein [Gemmatimonadota bacterium]
METVSPHTHSLQSTLTYVFAPMNKRALGIAIGVTSGGLIALATLLHVIIDAVHQPPLALLAQFFYGYTVSWPGVAIGFTWGFATGFVVGWSLALLRNVFTAMWLLSIRAKSTLSRPFLDKI